MKILENKRFEQAVFYLIFFFVCIIYAYGHNHYVVEHIDNAWSLSWARTWWDSGIRSDEVFGFPLGEAGSFFFGQTYVFVYGAVLEIIGWTRSNASIISFTLVASSAWLWMKILLKLGYSKTTSRWFPIVLLLLEGSFASSNMMRLDAIGFLFATMGFFTIVHQRFFFSGLCFIVAFEIHPYAAIMCGTYITSYVIYLFPDIRRNTKKYAKYSGMFFFGIVLGAIYYFSIHHQWLDEIHQFSKATNSEGQKSFFVSYLTNGKYSWRHWPEVIIWLAALITFLWGKCWKNDQFILPFVLVTVLVTIIVPHGSPHYIIYHYPPLILLTITQAHHFNIRPFIMIVLLLLMLPQYFMIFWIQRGYDHQAYIEKLRNIVPKESNYIYGHPSAWFAFQDKEFHPVGYFPRQKLSSEKWPDHFILIENKHFIRLSGWHDLDGWENHFSRRLITTFEYFDKTPVNIYSFSRNDVD